MASFSSGFLNSLTNPSFGRGMFDLGRSIGSGVRQAGQSNQVEQIAQMSPVEQADYQIEQAQTPQQAMVASGNKRSALLGAGAQSIDVLRQQLSQAKDPARIQQLQRAILDVAGQTGNRQAPLGNLAQDRQDAIRANEQAKAKQALQQLESRLLRETDPEQMKLIEQSMVRIADATGLPSAELIGAAGKVNSKRIKAESAQQTAMATARKKAEETLEDQIYSQMVESGNYDQVPAFVEVNENNIPVTTEMEDNLMKRITDRVKRDDEFAKATRSGVAPSESMDIINEYKKTDPDGFEANRPLVDALRIEEDTRGGKPSGRRREALRVIRDSANAIANQNLEKKRGGETAAIQAENFTRSILNQPDLVWIGGTLQDALADNPENITKFNKYVTDYLERHPEMLSDPQLMFTDEGEQKILDSVKDAFDFDEPAQEAQTARIEKRRKIENLQSNIREKLKRLYPSASNQEIDYLYDKQMTEIKGAIEADRYLGTNRMDAILQRQEGGQ